MRSGGGDGSVLARDNRVAALPAGRVTGRELVQGDGIGALAISPDGTTLAVGGEAGSLQVWDIARGQWRTYLPGVPYRKVYG